MGNWPHQLSLNVSLETPASFDNFVAGNNQALVSQVMWALEQQGFQLIYCWGGEDSGKTHLLQAAWHWVRGQGGEACYFDLSRPGLTSQMLDAQDSAELVCLDNLHHLTDSSDDQEAVFHLFNRLQLRQSKLLVAASQPPQALKNMLADLTSRLAWGLTYPLTRLDDEQKIQALQLRAQQKGILLPDEVARFVMHRSPRRLSVLFSLLDQMDQWSLNEHRKLTIPFVRERLKW